MSLSRVIEVSFNGGSIAYVKVDTAYFYNNGILFKPTDIDLPASYQVHWADSPQATTTLETIGTAEGAPIPDDLWNRSRVIYGWIYLHPTNDSSITAYEVRIYKNVRAGLPDGTEPTPAEQSTIDQLIGALNSAVEQTEDAAERIENMSVSATTLAEGESATVTKSEQDGVVHLAFGIPKGATGDDGYSPTANVSKTGKVATITITDKNGTTSAQVEDGTDGIDGISPSVSVTDITGGHRVVITDKDGAKSFDVEDGATGATPNLTIGTVETLEPTDDATATITGTPENPVLNLGIPQGDAGEVTLEDYYKAFPTDTASGAIASFTDGADDLPLKSLVVDINPVQDLHGQDSPYPAGGGKNLLPPSASATKTQNGISIVSDGNGKYTFSGTVSGGNYNQTFALDAPHTIEAEEYLHLMNAQSSGSITFILQDANGGIIYAPSFSGANRILDLSNYAGSVIASIRIYIPNGTTFSGTATPMIVKSSTATAFAPYENICPISGWTDVDVEQRGKNLFDSNFSDYTKPYNYYICPIKLENGKRYKLKAELVGTTITGASFGLVKSGNRYEEFVGPYYVVGVNGDTRDFNITVDDTFTAPKLIAYVSGENQFNEVLSNYNVMLMPYEQADYEPYSGQSITIALGQTVYGGKLDVLSGELVITHKGVDMGALSWSMQVGSGTQLTRFYTAGISSDVSRVQTSAEYPVMLDLKAPILIPHSNPVYSRIVDNAMCVLCSTGGLYATCSIYPSESDFTTAVSGMMLVYRLAEPITIQLTPNQLNSLYGVNNIWADSGNTEVEYRADTKLFIERLTAPDSADMIADANITSGQYFMVGNSLYKATANIANGSAIVVGTNCIRKSLSEALNEINA